MTAAVGAGGGVGQDPGAQEQGARCQQTLLGEQGLQQQREGAGQEGAGGGGPQAVSRAGGCSIIVPCSMKD